MARSHLSCSGSAAEAPSYDGSCQEELRVVVLVSDGARPMYDV